jgi:hypothetical protein
MTSTTVTSTILSLLAVVCLLVVTMAPESDAQFSRGLINNARRQLRRGNVCPFCQYCQYTRYCDSHCGPFSAFRNVCEFCDYSHHCGSTCRSQC